MKYEKRLRDPRWQRVRLEVMSRDGFRCLACGASDKTLTVHHVRYSGDNPWEAPTSDLQTLCEECHDRLGPHPRGCVGYDAGDPTPTFWGDACPACGKDVKDKDTCVRCCYCSWSYDLDRCPFGFSWGPWSTFKGFMSPTEVK